MTQEEKAKRYDEAIQRAMSIYNDKSSSCEAEIICENIFPELKESEDDEIRRWIINELKIKHHHLDEENVDFVDKAIAWLEKQCNKPQGKSALEAIKEEKVDNQICIKPNNKVEPKFHIGDWVVCEVTGSVYQIKNCVENLSNHKYGYDLTNGGYIGSDEVNHYHLWTIQDANDGDVLVASDGSIFICAGVVDCAYKYHVALTTNNTIEINKKVEGGYWDASRAVHPATKGETDFFFQKMHEAGYEWNAENKQLKKIEQKSVEWSEEDKNMLENTIYMVTMQRDENRSDNEYQRAEKCIDWLKSLKERYTWKPNEEQINALDSTLQYNQVSHNSFEYLNSLFNDLKKLKE